jgi:hypothetical protein
MATPTIADYLKYANLQMAAEAFLKVKDPKTDAWIENYFKESDLVTALITGNNHASRFTPTQAADFAEYWKVLDQKPNTTSGFSGTLFECIKDDPATGAKKDDLVISFRSTEFIDDAIRDSASTNTLEVHDTGGAWGLITDLEKWYAQLRGSGLIPDPQTRAPVHSGRSPAIRDGDTGRTTWNPPPNENHPAGTRLRQQPMPPGADGGESWASWANLYWRIACIPHTTKP